VAGRWSSLSRKPESRFLNPFLSMSTPNALVQKLWNYCNILRDDGLSYGDYVEQLTFLLFLKMADEQTKPPFNPPSPGGLRRAGNPSPVPAHSSRGLNSSDARGMIWKCINARRLGLGLRLGLGEGLKK
jgi:hypothetical protein